MNKDLQKFTDLKEFKKTEEFITYLKEDHKRLNSIIEELQNRLNDSISNKDQKQYKYIKLISQCFKIAKDKKNNKKFRNMMYEYNHSIISVCIHNYIRNNGIYPHQTTIADETGLSRQTIHKHLKDGLHSKYNSVVTKKLEYMSSNALTILYKIGVEQSNVSALKTYIELSNKNITNQNKEITNYIQINNLKLTTDELQELPAQTKNKIEQIIIDSIKSID